MRSKLFRNTQILNLINERVFKLHSVIYFGTIDNIINILNLIPTILDNMLKKCKMKLLYV